MLSLVLLVVLAIQQQTKESLHCGEVDRLYLGYSKSGPQGMDRNMATQLTFLTPAHTALESVF